MRIVFFGSDSFSLPALRRLCSSRHAVLAVVTAPDRPRGRGLRPLPTPVKSFARENGIRSMEPEDLQDPGFLQALREMRADLFAVVAFRILPKDVFEIPPHGTVNLHASLLPKYRGAAPVQWAILNGEATTGVTTFLINEKVDTGDILLQREVEIRPLETAGELETRLAEIGADVLLETIDGLESGRLTPRPQEGEPSHAPKIQREMGRIDWSRPADYLARLIRALSPDPGAFTFWGNKLLRLHRASEESRGIPHSATAEPGTVLLANARTGDLVVKAGESFVRILELQPSGKRIMSSGEFLRGYRLAEGDRLTREPAE
ncbi:MAG: methionyl-tRNA formyltransferase [candidate division KSB1 bacterium]|nr:methionyl-tRNA formyltransferase [candidate division KSB1 bacterium]